MKRKKIGLIGEAPNDTLSIQNLLSRKYPDIFQFKQLIKNKKGYQLNNSRAVAALKLEFAEYSPDHVLFIRDADALPSEVDKIQVIKDWYEKMNQIVDKRGILLINIYELEALILADIGTFNKLYRTSIQYSNNCMHQKEPKEFLKQKTSNYPKIYSEAHCPEIFKHLSFDLLVANCTYFKDFDTSIKNLITN